MQRILSIAMVLSCTLPCLADWPGLMHHVNQIGREFGIGWSDGYHACSRRKRCLFADCPPKPFATSSHFGRHCGNPYLQYGCPNPCWQQTISYQYGPLNPPHFNATPQPSLRGNSSLPTPELQKIQTYQQEKLRQETTAEQKKGQTSNPFLRDSDDTKPSWSDRTEDVEDERTRSVDSSKESESDEKSFGDNTSTESGNSENIRQTDPSTTKKLNEILDNITVPDDQPETIPMDPSLPNDAPDRIEKEEKPVPGEDDGLRRLRDLQNNGEDLLGWEHSIRPRVHRPTYNRTKNRPVMRTHSASRTAYRGSPTRRQVIVEPTRVSPKVEWIREPSTAIATRPPVSRRFEPQRTYQPRRLPAVR